MDQPQLSIVFSFRNEESVIPVLLERLEKTLSALGVSYELLFVNDASTDTSLSLLTQEAGADSRIKVLTTAERVGVAPCLLAGMNYAQGAAVITMDTDLQDPPEVIPSLIEEWRAGADIVSTIRSERQGESSFKMALTRLAYQILKYLSPHVDLPVDAGDFRLLSREAVRRLLMRTGERKPYLRGQVQMLGLKQAFIFYRREKRFSGQSHFPLLSRGPVETFLSGLFFCAGTVMPPQRFAGLLSFFAGLAGICLGILTQSICLSDSFQPGVTAVFFLTAAAEGLLLFLLGALFFKISEDASPAPLYRISETLNVSPAGKEHHEN